MGAAGARRLPPPNQPNMRKLSFLLFLLCGLGTVSAQELGVRVGLNSTNARFDVGDIEVETDGQANLMLGLFANLPIGTSFFTVQPELNYVNRGYNQQSFNIDGIASGEAESTYGYLDLGVLARLNFGADEGLGFYVGAGPQLSYAVSGSITTVTRVGNTDTETERDVDFDSDPINRSELQFSGVAGITFGAGLKFFAEGRYNGSLSNQSDLDNTDIRQRSLGVNVGVMVPL